MQLANIRAGDVVEVEIRGDRFYAKAVPEEADRGKIVVVPISNGRGPFRIVTARQIVGHYRKSKASR